MSMPDEEIRAMKAASQFLYELLDPKATPRVPKEIRERARRIVKHYPLDVIVDLEWKTPKC